MNEETETLGVLLPAYTRSGRAARQSREVGVVSWIRRKVSVIAAQGPRFAEAPDVIF